MNNNGWITDRLPRQEDATFDPCRYEDGEFHGVVWVSSAGVCKFSDWEIVKPGQPWQPVQRPNPYVKPNRFVAMYFDNYRTWGVKDTHSVEPGLPNLFTCQKAAERIAAIYNEVME